MISEYSERAKIGQEFLLVKAREDLSSQHWIDEAILKSHKSMRDFFRLYWSSKHLCEVEGCRWSLVTDGGLKPHRYKELGQTS